MQPVVRSYILVSHTLRTIASKIICTTSRGASNARNLSTTFTGSRDRTLSILFSIMYRFCSNFCVRFACFLRKGPTLFFEKSGVVVVINDEILGEGGFSTVYKASSKKDPSMKYAVKRVLVQTDDIKRTILAEIQSLRNFHHPNIIKLIDSLDNRDHSNNRVVYLLFPLIRRGTLRHVLNERVDDPQRTNLDFLKILDDFKAICSAFNYMHTFTPVHYIHQDIKPEVRRSMDQL